MALRFRGIVEGVDTPLNIAISDLQVQDVQDGSVFITAVSGPDGGLSRYQLAEGQLARLTDTRSFTADMGALSEGTLSLIDVAGQTVIVTGTDAAGMMYGYGVESAGGIGPPVRLAGYGGADPAQAGVALSRAGYLYVADGGNGWIYGLRPDGQGGFTRQAAHNGASIGTGDAVALATADVGGQEYLLVLDRGSDSLGSYLIAPGGGLTLTGEMGADKGLGLLGQPTALEVIATHGKTFVIVASAAEYGQGGALSVLELAPGGGLTPTDHLLDSLHTRFAMVQDIAVVRSGDQVFVLAGGGDDGISLFALLPDGALVHLQTLVHEAGFGLANVAAIAAVRLGDEMQVFVASQMSPGLAQLTFSLLGRNSVLSAADTGQPIAGQGGDDVLMGGAGDDRLDGGAGDDIIVDGAGDDRLTGGAGADLFVLRRDATRDRIIDFDPGQDRLDLSDFPMLYDPAQLTIVTQANGARITWRDERIDIASAYGGALDPEAVRAAIALGPDRPPLLILREATGTMEVDRLEGYWGSDMIRGLAGNDLLQGQDGDDQLFGGDGDDTLSGGDGDDTLRGGDGDDLLNGGDGHDRLVGGAGTDMLIGGAGNDTLLGQTQDDQAFGDAGDDLIHGNGGNDTLGGGDGNDTIVGGIHDDVIYGGAGNDTVIGGPGRDWANLGPGDDLFLDMAERGLSGSDTVLGGDGNDTIQGGGGGDLFDGQGGDDLILGRNGNDTLSGGAGDDTILGGAGADQVHSGDGRDRVFLHGGDDVWHDTPQRGRAGADFVTGGHGDDRFHAGGGNDTLSGGAGADVFIFTTGGETDQITDFRKGQDTLRLDDALWAGSLTPAQVVSQFGSIRQGMVVLDFGDTEIWLQGVDSLNGLANDIDIF